jgi:hypothetical protein
MSDRTFGVGLKRLQHFDFMHQLCFSVFNPRRECTGINLRLTSPKHLAVLPHGPENPFAAPLVSSLALNPFRAGPALLHRHRSVGTVTLHRQRPAWRGKGAKFQNLDRGQSR